MLSDEQADFEEKAAEPSGAKVAPSNEAVRVTTVRWRFGMNVNEHVGAAAQGSER